MVKVCPLPVLSGLEIIRTSTILTIHKNVDSFVTFNIKETEKRLPHDTEHHRDSKGTLNKGWHPPLMPDNN